MTTHVIFIIAIINLFICQLQSYQDENTITKHDENVSGRRRKHALHSATLMKNEAEFYYGRQSKRTRREASNPANPEAPVITTMSPMLLDKDIIYPAGEQDSFVEFAPPALNTTSNSTIEGDPGDTEILLDVVIDTIYDIIEAGDNETLNALYDYLGGN